MAKIQKINRHRKNDITFEQMVIKHNSSDPYSPVTLVFGELRITIDLHEQILINSCLNVRNFKRSKGGDLSEVSS